MSDAIKQRIEKIEKSLRHQRGRDWQKSEESRIQIHCMMAISDRLELIAEILLEKQK